MKLNWLWVSFGGYSENPTQWTFSSCKHGICGRMSKTWVQSHWIRPRPYQLLTPIRTLVSVGIPLWPALAELAYAATTGILSVTQGRLHTYKATDVHWGLYSWLKESRETQGSCVAESWSLFRKNLLQWSRKPREESYSLILMKVILSERCVLPPAWSWCLLPSLLLLVSSFHFMKCH